MGEFIDLSGILPLATQKNNTNTGKVTQKAIFQVDEYGSIILKSLKGSRYTQLASKYDKDRNGKLQLNEIGQFLADKSIKKDDIDTGYNRLIYYQETDSNGRIIKRAYFGKGNKSQYVYTYDKNGVPVECTELSVDGTSYSYDLKNGSMKMVDSDGTYDVKLSHNALRNLKSIGVSVYSEHSPVSLLDRIKALFY